jgi:ribosomal-protein-alanine N-acetyltransferase
MTPDQLEKISEMEKTIFSDAWSKRSLSETMENPFTDFLVALDDREEPIGYLIGYTLVPEGEIANLAVCEKMRRKGVGWGLLHAYLERCREKSCDTFYLEVRASNSAAISLYEKVGFRPYGRRKRYYSHPTEDAILMIYHETKKREEEWIGGKENDRT